MSANFAFVMCLRALSRPNRVRDLSNIWVCGELMYLPLFLSMMSCLPLNAMMSP